LRRRSDGRGNIIELRSRINSLSGNFELRWEGRNFRNYRAIFKSGNGGVNRPPLTKADVVVKGDAAAIGCAPRGVKRHNIQIPTKEAE
jgi:hypothetical protein